MISGVATLVNNLGSPPEPLDEDARLRDAVVGRAQVPLPEPWFIRDIRQRAPSDERQADGPAETAPVVNFAPAAVEPAARTAVPAQVRPGRATGWIAVAGLAAVAAVAGGLVAVGLQNSPPAARIIVAPPVVSPAASSAAAARCARPETVEKLRAIVVDAVPGVAGSARLRQLAAGLSVGATGRPSGPGRPASDCTGWLTLSVPGQDARPLVVPVDYVATAAGQVEQVTGLAPLIARLGELARPPQVAVPPVAPPTARPEAAAPKARKVAAVDPVMAKARQGIVKKAVSAGQPRRLAGPSFSCRNLRSDAVRLICGDRRLAAQDRAVARRLDRAETGASPEELRRIDAERTLFLNRRESCDSAACVRRLYQRQLDALPRDPRTASQR